MATISDTLTTYPSGYDNEDYSYASVNSSYPLSNAVGQPSTNTSTYSRWNITTGSQAESWLYYLFDCSSIPEGATIDSVSCSVRCSISSTSSFYISSKTIQLYSSSTAKGSSTTVSSTSSTSYTLSCGSWTREELQNCKLKFYAKRASYSTSTSRYFNFYGATLTVSYTYNGETYTITSSATGGTIEPNGEITVSGGDSVTFSMIPDTGNVLKSFTVNGTEITPTEETSAGISNGICLCHFDNDVTDILDISTISNNGGTISSTKTKFNKSLYFDGSSYLQIALDKAYSDNITIEFWFYTDHANTSGDYPTIFSTNTANASGGTYVHVDDGSYSTYPVCRCNATGSGNNGTYGSTVISRGAWHHFAYCRSGSNHYYFLDGNLQATVSQSSPQDIEAVYIGGLYNGSSMTSDCYFTGYVDELLISSVCKWTSSFSVPTTVYNTEEITTYTYTLSNIQNDYTVAVVFGTNEETAIFMIKNNGSWKNVSTVYKKINGRWVEQNDLSALFDTEIKYIKG